MKLLGFNKQFGPEDDCIRYLKEQKGKGRPSMSQMRRHQAYLPSHIGVEKVVACSERQTVPGKEAPKILPWVHVAISNAKSLFKDMYHGIKQDFLQSYLDEFCYKFNRMYFGDKTFERLVIASIKYRPTFEHRLYNSSHNCG